MQDVFCVFGPLKFAWMSPSNQDEPTRNSGSTYKAVKPPSTIVFLFSDWQLCPLIRAPSQGLWVCRRQCALNLNPLFLGIVRPPVPVLPRWFGECGLQGIDCVLTPGFWPRLSGWVCLADVGRGRVFICRAPITIHIDSSRGPVRDRIL